MKDVEIQMLKHNDILSKYACYDHEAKYLSDIDTDLRTPYFRDIDRIIYSLSFIRYQDKTQVFSKIEHDHVARRMIHVQFVSKIARTIGRALGLNEDLIEASALGHDLGHVPFGHEGEFILNDISLKYNQGFFNHNIQSVRNLMYVENYGKGLNISIQVLDAIMCHNGEFALGKYEPKKKTKEEFLEEYEKSYTDKKLLKTLKPMTLEGCVVRISDMIAYLGRDIDDAVRLKILNRLDIPTEITSVLGSNTREIVNTCILDIINNSYNKNYILLSDKVYEAIVKLKKFNYENIYNKSYSAKRKSELKIMFEELFIKYLNDLKTNNRDSLIVNSYLKNMTLEYKNNNSYERIVLDYIAGMTDDFFISEYKKYFNNEELLSKLD
ncbi:MAG: HD domain-containing protein [Firmicutes bacterium]|nr:HD domain-containing protein [Bacillota bacterium]